jgi:methylenetetrahydromethanopterin dehydrogenase
LVRIGFLKLGNIATAPMIELLLDERAERNDMEVRVVSSGANMGSKQSEDVANIMVGLKPQLVFITSPNASTKGPTKARGIVAAAGIPVVVVSDGPKDILEELGPKGMGAMIIEADSMIGARREFLDPIEMALFNSDVTRVLSVTGVFNIIYECIDKLIEQLKKGENLTLPLFNISRSKAVKAAGFTNPYAEAKAAAAYEMARRVAAITSEACFKEKNWETYTALCAVAHELMRAAAEIADDAREIEKYGDTVLRKPHYDDGSYLGKKKLMEKPQPRT